MLYEIINPHDKATFEAKDDETAVLAMLVLGEGKYGCEDEASGRVCSIAFFGFPDNVAGVTEENLSERLNARNDDISAALASVIYCSLNDRKAVIASGGDLEKFNEAKRSSMTDLAGRAHALAKALKGDAEARVKAESIPAGPIVLGGT